MRLEEEVVCLFAIVVGRDGDSITGNARVHSGVELVSRLPFQAGVRQAARHERSEEHTSELQSRLHLVCRLLLEKKKKKKTHNHNRGRQETWMLSSSRVLLRQST